MRRRAPHVRARAAVCVLLCACAVAACVMRAEARQGDAEARRREAWLGLLKFEGRDMHSLEDGEADAVAGFTNLLLDRKDPENFALVRRPRLLARVKTGAGERVVLLDSQFFCISPGQTWHYLYFFDESGKLLGSSYFSAGWRICPSGASLTTRAGLDAPLLKMEGGGLGGFALASGVVEYYALLGDRAVLVRLEDGEGSVLRNGYGCEYPSVGPPEPERTADEWARALSSRDKVELLQALMWVGGRHQSDEWLSEELNGEKHGARPANSVGRGTVEPDPCARSYEDVRTFVNVRARDDVRLRLKDLAGSDDVWVRQAAESALDALKNYYSSR